MLLAVKLRGRGVRVCNKGMVKGKHLVLCCLWMRDDEIQHPSDRQREGNQSAEKLINQRNCNCLARVNDGVSHRKTKLPTIAMTPSTYLQEFSIFLNAY